MQLVASRRRPRWRQVVFAAMLLLVLTLVLGWFFPARWAIAWISPRLQGLQFNGVHGSLWDGRADRVLRADGTVLGQVSWQVSRRALVAVVPLQVELNGPQLAFSGSMQAPRKGQVRWDNVHLQADLALLRSPVLSALGKPLGKLSVVVERAVLQDGWPLQLELRAQWRDAAVLARGTRVALGAVDAQAIARAGVVDITLADVDNGPLQVLGAVRLSPLGWGLNLHLHPRQADPALRQWLATLGQADATGTVIVQRRAGLMSIPSISPTTIASSVLPPTTQRGKP